MSIFTISLSEKDLSKLQGSAHSDVQQALSEAVAMGRVTRDAALHELLTYAQKYQTLDGFLVSRLWARGLIERQSVQPELIGPPEPQPSALWEKFHIMDL
ncbi:hypothetical protein [Acidovorax temperans]|uniref:hypothetical protein n=1 Tax=Acidovorax temperans TaxID=80878 RepID=UPI0030CE9669